MSVNRRSVLKGITLGSFAGLALTLGRSLRALAGGTDAQPSMAAVKPLLALVNEGVAGSVFLHGAAAAHGAALQAQTVSHDLRFILDFERQLHTGPIRVIGLLDNASATLVVDQARRAGARVQWLGQHVAEAGYTRHRLLETDIAEDYSRQLSRHLHASGAGFQMIEERQGGAASPRRSSAPLRSAERAAEWASGLGYVLGSLGAQPAMSAPAPLADVVLRGSFVSFLIETSRSLIDA